MERDLTNRFEIKEAAANIELLDREKINMSIAVISDKEGMDSVKFGHNQSIVQSYQHIFFVLWQNFLFSENPYRFFMFCSYQKFL